MNTVRRLMNLVLGDAVLELIVSEYLYSVFQPNGGELTGRRAVLVCEPTLARLADRLDLGRRYA